MIELTGEVAIDASARLTRLERAASRDTRFAALVERQSRFLFRVAFAIVRNAYDAEDIVQETFWKLYRTGAWERIENEQAFLGRTVWRIAVRKLRKHKGDPAGLDLQATEAKNPEEALIASDRCAVVQRLVNALPDELRLPLALAALDELKSREIALILGIPEGTVRTRIQRARQILKERLAAMTGGSHAK